jgi:flagellar M-ring protein FliF
MPQARLFFLIFAVMLASLGAAYYLFLRADYVVLYSELRAPDAAAVVTELDRQGISYELRDNGATILVPQDEVSTVRLAIAGANLPVNGLVGFELFNESDMGLTEFAQRINYQRALQGELARTIMMMDGIENARVHLAIPERSLFRSGRTEARAAVTVVPKRGRMLDEARVGGIQRLVAASIADLSVAQVVVLDEAGRVLSGGSQFDAALPPAMEEQSAVQSYYRARVRSAVEQVLPGVRFDVRVSVPASPAPGGAPAAGPTLNGMDAAAASGEGRRNFRLLIAITTASPLGQEEQAQALGAIRGAAELDESAGDSVTFTVGPVQVAPPVITASAPAPARVPYVPASSPAPRADGSGWWGGIAAVFALLAALLFARTRRRPAEAEERDAFVQRLRLQLEPVKEERGA